MKLTIKSGEFKAESTVDAKHKKPSYSSYRTYGVFLLGGIATLDKLSSHVNFFLEERNVVYNGRIYILSNYLAPSLRAYRANKRCACERLILCPCHDKCEKCGNDDCELARKSYTVITTLASRVLTGIITFNSRYDDERENEARGEN